MFARHRVKLFLILGLSLLLLIHPASGRAGGWMDVIDSASKLGNALLNSAASLGNKAASPDSEVIVTSEEDIIARALDQIKLSEKIAKKTEEMETEVGRVFTRIRTYQAMQGAIWFNIGKSYYQLQKDIAALEMQGKGGCSCGEFCRRTRAKRLAQIELLNQVDIKPTEGLVDTAEVIRLNNKTNRNLRLAVSEVVSKNPLLAETFAKQINRQNKALDDLLKAYTERVGDIYLSYLFAERSFNEISKELGKAAKEMSRAIKRFNEQGRLVAAEATKHIAILALHGAKLSALLKDHDRSFWQNIQLGAQVANLIKRIGRLTMTLRRFVKTRKKFAAESAVIRRAAAQAREEIAASGLAVRSLRKKLNRSWARQMAAIRKVTKKEKIKVLNLKQEMAAIEKKNRKLTRRMYASLRREAIKKADKAFGKPVF